MITNTNNNTDNVFSIIDTMSNKLQSMTAGDVENEYLVSLLDPFNRTARLPPVTLVPTCGKKIDISHAITVTADMKEVMLYWVPHSDRPESQLQIGIRHTNDNLYWTYPAPSWSEDLALNYTQYRLVSSGITSRSNALSTGQFYLTGSGNSTIAEDHPDVHSLNYSNIYGYKRADSSARMSVPAADGVVMLSRPVANITLKPFRSPMRHVLDQGDFYPHGVNESSQSSYKYHFGSNALDPLPTTRPFHVQMGTPDNRNLSLSNGMCAFRVRVHLRAENQNAGDCTLAFYANTFSGGVYTLKQQIGAQNIVPTISPGTTNSSFTWSYEGVYSAPVPITDIEVLHPSGQITLTPASYVVIEQIGEEEDGLLYPGYFTIWKGLGTGQDLLISGSANYELIANPEISKQVKASLPSTSVQDNHTALGFLRMLMHSGIDGVLSYPDYRDLIKVTRRMMLRENLVPYGMAAPFSFLKPLVPHAMDLATTGLKSMMKGTCEKLRDVGWAMPYMNIDVPNTKDLVTDWSSDGPVFFYNGHFDGAFDYETDILTFKHKRLVLRDEVSGHIVLSLGEPISFSDPFTCDAKEEQTAKLLKNGEIYEDTIMRDSLAVYVLPDIYEQDYLKLLLRTKELGKKEGYASTTKVGSFGTFFRKLKVKPSLHVPRETISSGPKSSLYTYEDYVRKSDSYFGYKKDQITRKKRPEAQTPGFMQYPYVSDDSVQYGLLCFTSEPVDFYPEGSGQRKGEVVKYGQSSASKIFADGKITVHLDDSMDTEAKTSILEALRFINSTKISEIYVTNVSEHSIKGGSLQGAALYWALGGFNFVTISAQFSAYTKEDTDYIAGVKLVPIGLAAQKAAVGNATPVVLSVPLSISELEKTVTDIISNGVEGDDIVLPGQMILGAPQKSSVYLVTNYFNLLDAADAIGATKTNVVVVDVIPVTQMQPLITKAREKSQQRSGIKVEDEFDDFVEHFADYYAQDNPQFANVYGFRNATGTQRNQFDQAIRGFLRYNPPTQYMDNIPTALVASKVPVDDMLDVIMNNVDSFGDPVLDQTERLSAMAMVKDGQNYYPRKETNILWNLIGQDHKSLGGGIAAIKALLPKYFTGGRTRASSQAPTRNVSAGMRVKSSISGPRGRPGNPRRGEDSEPVGGGGFGGGSFQAEVL